MTNGLPLIVRGAMKPLPTLTKPLRSVDTETHEPAQALRERTDSCNVPAAGVVGEAMVAFVLADAYREQVRRRPHRRRARGRERLPGADRVAIVLIGFMGAGKSTAARELGAALGAERPSTATRCWPSSSATRSPRSSRSAARPPSAPPRRQLVLRAARRAPARTTVIALGGGSVLSDAGAGALRARDDGAARRRRRARPGSASRATARGAERPLASDREAFEALHAERAPLYERLAEAVVRPGRASSVARAGADAAR